MSIIDKALEANRDYAKNYDPTLGKDPAPKIVVVTCMDPQLSDLPGILGLPQRKYTVRTPLRCFVAWPAKGIAIGDRTDLYSICPPNQ
jgi:hypothetical protein